MRQCCGCWYSHVSQHSPCFDMLLRFSRVDNITPNNGTNVIIDAECRPQEPALFMRSDTKIAGTNRVEK